MARPRRPTQDTSRMGGVRQGTPGVAHGNRTDLNQPVRAAAGQTYGERGAQEAAQQAIPLPQATPVRPLPTPDDVPSLAAPTARPNEPVTAGLPIGAGPGPGVLGKMLPNPAGDPVTYLEALYTRTQDPSVLAMLTEARNAQWLPAAPTPL